MKNMTRKMFERFVLHGDGHIYAHTIHIQQYNYSSYLRNDRCSPFGHVNLITRVFSDIQLERYKYNVILSSDLSNPF